MAATVPHQGGMLLGRTFDLQKLRPGLDIFTDDCLAKSRVTDTPQTTIRYAVIKEAKDINNILEMAGEISLKCKAGIVKVDGMGSYLKEDRSNDNTLEILARAHVETITESMTDTTPKAGWNENVVGTHFIRSITYGGDLIVRIRIEGSDSKHFEDIKAKVDAELHVGGVIDAGAKANFRKMEEDLKSSSKINISYFSTTLQGTMPRDVDGMLRALDSFKDQVVKLNEGKGAALICELQPLSVLDAKLTNVLRDKSLDVQLKTLEDSYDDVIEAKARLKRLMDRVDIDLNQEQESSASEMEDRIDQVVSEFNRVIGNLDVTTQGAGPSQMDSAFSLYKKSKKAGGYNREVAKFVKSVLPPPAPERPPTTPVQDLPHGKRLDLMLVGKTGHGKSATGNTILGGDTEIFHSKMSTSSVTSKCQKEFREIGKRELCVMDTPGTMDTKDPEGTLKEMGTAIASMPDGYHAFLIVLSVNTRMTPEEQMAIRMLKKLFGQNILMEYAVLVFTYGDLFYTEQSKRGGKLKFKDFIKSQDGELAKLLHESSNRYVLFNNCEQDPGKRRNQVIELINTVDKLQSEVNGKKYTNDLFERAKKMVEEEEEREKQRQANAKQAEEKELKDKLAKARQEGKDEGIAEKVGEQLADQAKQEGRGCFLGDAHVEVEGGGTISMEEVRVGNKVLSTLVNGRKVFSEVYFFGHRDELGISQYINVSTARTALKMTPDHHVYLVRDGQSYTIPSEQIKIGDHILVHNAEKNSLEEEVVTQLAASTEVGVYSPLTMSGTIIVNNMFVSCYGDYVSPRLSHTLLWPMRQLHRISPSLSSWLNTPLKDGMPVWVRWCMEKIILPYRG